MEATFGNLSVNDPDHLTELAGIICNKSKLEEDAKKKQYDLMIKKEQVDLNDIVKACKKLDHIMQSRNASTPWPSTTTELIRNDIKDLYLLIPHKQEVIPNINPKEVDDLLTKKRKVLDYLLNIRIARENATGNALCSFLKSMKTKINVLDKRSNEYSVIEKYVRNSHSSDHDNYMLKMEKVFTVCREEDEKKFRKLYSNHMLLWHGSKVNRYMGIICDGLRIAPPRENTGGMFGNGIYFADRVSKSANHCKIRKGDPDPVGIILLCEVALGESEIWRTVKTGGTEFTGLKNGYHSVKVLGKKKPEEEVTMDDGKLRVPLGVEVSSGCETELLNNEYVIFDPDQVKMRYMVQVRFNYK